MSKSLLCFLQQFPETFPHVHATSLVYSLHCSKHHPSPWKFTYTGITLPTLTFAGDACLCFFKAKRLSSVHLLSALLNWVQNTSGVWKQLVLKLHGKYMQKKKKKEFFYNKDLYSTVNVLNPYPENKLFSHLCPLSSIPNAVLYNGDDVCIL